MTPQTSPTVSQNTKVSTPPPTVPKISSRQLRRIMDRAATVVITIGGMTTILSILGIFAYLFIEVAPLFYPVSENKIATVKVEKSNPQPKNSENIGVGIDEYMEVAYVLRGNDISLYQIPSGDPLLLNSVPKFDQGQISAIARSSGKGHKWGLGTRDGQVIPLSIKFNISFNNEQRSIHPVVTTDAPLEIPSGSESINLLAYKKTENGQVAAALTESGHLYVLKAEESSGGLFSMEEEIELFHTQILDDRVPSITTLLLDSLGENLLAGTKDGQLLFWDLRDFERPRLTGAHAVKSAITALAYLIGDRSIVVGTKEGAVEVWMPFDDPDKGGDPELQKIRAFTPHQKAVTTISPSQRDKGFITTDASGSVAVHHSTSGQTLLELPGGGSPVRGTMFSPKADGVITLHENGRLDIFAIDNEHPETTFSSLFRPVLYEGYDEPHHIWQSTGGSDSFEPKFGLWPLIFGTLKGTIYALVFATPIAILGAIYTAMFMHPDLRSIVKPAVETMEALPTVVLGFLAGLWFAPLLEKIFPAISAMFVVLPVAIIVVCCGWQFLPSWFRRQSGQVTELLTFLVVLMGSIWICLSLNTEIETWMYDSNYKQWLQNTFGVGYDQRNALVIAFAMGMAVIPTIFSITEDSISNVPRHLIAGSLAMGATPWQTLTKLVIVSASPGIFSALMIGLGRVVGETMIVLMATGNTPVMDMNLFNGFRTLSANIAVEMPEAPHGGTLYRLLFMAGLILFVFTSVVNTIAEIVRQRLRARYSQF